MKILVDTNVILDVLCNRSGFVEASLKIWKLCEVGRIDGYISALSVPNIVYILRKELDPEKTDRLITQIMMIFKIADLRSTDIRAAAALRADDFEDALQMCQAERINADHIITRNIRDFKSSKVSALKPSELLERI